MTERELTAKQKLFVSYYIGEAKGNATEAARLAGYKGSDETLRVTGSENLTKPNIKLQIDSALGETIDRNISIKQNRIDAINDRWERMKRLIEIRAEDKDVPDEKGGRTGLLVHTLKVVGAGQSQQIIDEYAFDASLMREMRELEKEAATELGQLTDNLNVTGGIERRYVIVRGDD